MVEKERTLSWRFLIFYCIAFFLLWGVMEIVLLPVMENTVGVWSEALKESVIKLLIWTLPAIPLIRYFEKDMWQPLKKMFTTKVNWWPWLGIAAGFFLLRIINVRLSLGRIGISADFQAVSLVNTVLFVGMTEEVVFRGWLLGATLKKLRYWPAVCVNAALFVLIHFPIWIRSGQLSDPLTVLGSCATIFALSVLFSWAYTRSGHLFVPIVLHMSWNLGIVVFLGG